MSDRIIEDKDRVKAIRHEIWRLAQSGGSMDLLHWYVSLDDCFENDEFDTSDAENMRWRIGVLTDKGEPTKHLYDLIDELLPMDIKRRLSNHNVLGEVLRNDRI